MLASTSYRIKLNILVDPKIPEDELHGYGDGGELLYRVTMFPKYRLIFGDPDEKIPATVWHVNKHCSDRLNAMALWKLSDFETVGHG